MVSSLYLLWLPIALLAVSVRSDDHLLSARNALASEISDIQAEFGDNVDTSLDGYDHELLSTRDTDDVDASAWDKIRDKTARILKPHHKVTRDVDDEDWEPISKRDMIEHQKRALEAQHGDEYDFSLEGYDEALLDEDEGEDDLEKRDVEDEDQEIDYSLEGYDEDLISDYLTKRDAAGDESDLVPEVEEEGVDYSLDGYDESLLTKRSDDEEGEDEDYDLPDGDGTPYDADFDSSRYLAAWDSESGIHERDFEDDGDDEILGTEPEGEYGPEDDEIDPNDRYYEPDEGSESEVVTGAVRRDVRVDEEDDEDEDEVDGEQGQFFQQLPYRQWGCAQRARSGHFCDSGRRRLSLLITCDLSIVQRSSFSHLNIACDPIT